jgi:UDP-2-acetamido-3-amino-2,3-dideoxy-glucuronate N-acetyltransferase
MSHPFETYPAIAADATVAPEARIEPGARICSRSSIGGQVRLANSVFLGRHVCVSGEVNIGRNVHIDDHVSIVGPADIAADVWIGRETSIGAHRAPGVPGSVELARTRIGERALIGKGCVLEAGICLGELSFVRQRAHLYGDLPAHGMAYGDPAVLHNFLCSCGAVLSLKQRSGIIITLICPRCSFGLRITEAEMQQNGHILLPGGQVGARLSLGSMPMSWEFSANLE